MAIWHDRWVEASFAPHVAGKKVGRDFSEVQLLGSPGGSMLMLPQSSNLMGVAVDAR